MAMRSISLILITNFEIPYFLVSSGRLRAFRGIEEFLELTSGGYRDSGWEDRAAGSHCLAVWGNPAQACSCPKLASIPQSEIVIRVHQIDEERVYRI